MVHYNLLDRCTRSRGCFRPARVAACGSLSPPRRSLLHVPMKPGHNYVYSDEVSAAFIQCPSQFVGAVK